MATPAKASTLADLLLPMESLHGALRVGLLALLGTALLTLSAKLQVPFHPVPMTLQTLVVLVIGMAFGARLGAATVLLYLAEGAVGLPVFAGTPAKGIGLAYMVGPTGGYLVGFVVAAAVAGWIVERRRDLVGIVLAVAAGLVANYVPGLLWLATFVGFGQALALGLMPFVLGDLVKAGLAVAMGAAGAAVMRRRIGA